MKRMQIDYLYDHPVSPEVQALERWCAIGSDVAIAFAVGFLAIAALTW